MGKRDKKSFSEKRDRNGGTKKKRRDGMISGICGQRYREKQRKDSRERIRDSRYNIGLARKSCLKQNFTLNPIITLL